MDRDEGLLRRWSRRKAEARERAETPTDPGLPAPEATVPEGGPAAPAAHGAEPAPAPGAEGDEAQADAVRDLPDIDSLDKDSDYSGFLRAGVPEALRNRALQRLWRSDPVFANLDGLLEYGEDYTDAATVVKDMKTAYQVGRGYLTEEEHAELTRKPEETAEAPEEAGGKPDEAAEQAASGSEGEDEEEAGGEGEDEEEAGGEGEDEEDAGGEDEEDAGGEEEEDAGGEDEEEDAGEGVHGKNET